MREGIRIRFMGEQPARCWRGNESEEQHVETRSLAAVIEWSRRRMTGPRAGQMERAGWGVCNDRKESNSVAVLL